jgi:hypothetical protein
MSFNRDEEKRLLSGWFETVAFDKKPGTAVKPDSSDQDEDSIQASSDGDRESEFRDLIDGLSDENLEKLVALAEEYLTEDSDEVAAAAGSKFKRLAAELASRGVRDPEGLAAWIGRKKYGRAKFAEMAKRGRRNVDAAADVDPSAAEPKSEKPNQEEGDAMSLSEIRSRLGLAEDADETAMLAAVDALKVKAETPAVPAEPSPEQVAAAAAVAAERDGLAKQVDLLDQQVKAMSAQLSEANAAQAATVKASVLDAAQADGKFTPADREQWEADYDAAPAAVTRVLASIAAGTAVPVKPAGKSGSNEPSEADVDAEFAALFPPTAQEVAK